MAVAGLPKPAHAQVIDFDRLDSPGVTISQRGYHRIERFLTRVFPVRQMKRYAHASRSAMEGKPTRLRTVTYQVISQEGVKFILAGYSAQWGEPVNELAIYRMEPDGPNQVWRSRPWEGSSGDLHFLTVPAREREIVLFQEGGTEGEFSLASVFTFRNAPEGLLLHDLTPSLPWLRAQAHFPFRTLYGEDISLRVSGDSSPSASKLQAKEVVLTASDEEFNLGMVRPVRPCLSWKYNATRGRFEPMKPMPPAGDSEASNN
jgi:hypothetical protein